MTNPVGSTISELMRMNDKNIFNVDEHGNQSGTHSSFIAGTINNQSQSHPSNSINQTNHVNQTNQINQINQESGLSPQDRHNIQRTFMDIVSDNGLNIDITQYLDDENYMINVINTYTHNKSKNDRSDHNVENNNEGNLNSGKLNEGKANNKFNYRLLFMPVIMTIIVYVMLIYKSDIMKYINEYRVLNYKYVREMVVSIAFFCVYVFLDYIL